jgi:exosortase C (VPDSG-CTERM-specific)
MDRPASNKPSEARESAGAAHRGMQLFWIATAVLSLCFFQPLIELTRLALKRDLYSHILLIPFISFYLCWERRKQLPARSSPEKMAAAISGALGILFLTGFLIMRASGGSSAVEDSLALEIPAFLSFFVMLCYVFFGRQIVSMFAFPIGFLVFMVPFPVFLLDWIVSGLQVGSAVAADIMFELAGTPVVFQGLRFQLPDITLEVAPECSGIHSSLALLVTSVLAAFLFLRTPWKRIVLILAVIPLALIRNGFRVFTIGELCVHVGPQMIDSYIHRHGGPIFFALSLAPFFALLLWFSKGDRRDQGIVRPQSAAARK